MIFSCNAQELNRALSIVSHSMAVRSPKPILEGVLLESCEEGLRLTCTDGMIGIETVIASQISEDGRVVLPGKLFCDTVRKLPGGECKIDVSDRFVASLSCQSFRMTLSGLDAVEYPELPDVTGESFLMEEGTLRGMIEGTLFATATDESRPILTGCLMELTSADITMVALDGFRLALRREAVHGPDHNVQTVLGNKIMGDLSHILGEEEDKLDVVVSPSHTMFRIGKTRIIARSLEGEYIRYRQILPNEWKTQCTVNRRDLTNAIDRAGLVAREGKSNLVRFIIEGEEVTVTSNSENSDMEEKVSAAIEGSGLTIAFNIRYVTDILRAIADESIVMRYNSNVSPCVIVPPDGSGGYLYLVLPVRIFGS